MSWFGRLLWRTFLSIVALFMLVVIIPGVLGLDDD